MDVCWVIAWTHWSDLCQCPYWGFTVKKTFVYSLHTAQDNSNWKQNVTHTLDPHLQEQRCILVNTLSCSRSWSVLGWTSGSSYRFYLHSSVSEEPPARGQRSLCSPSPGRNLNCWRTEVCLSGSSKCGKRRHRNRFNGQQIQSCFFCSHTEVLSHFRSRWRVFVTLDDTFAGHTVMLWDSLLNHLAYVPTNHPCQAVKPEQESLCSCYIHRSASVLSSFNSNSHLNNEYHQNGDC